MKRRTICGAAACALAHPLVVRASDAYPAKPIRIVVPFAAGISPDVVGRIVADKLSQSWKQPVIVDNRPGASGMIGAEAVAASTPDGYTLLLAVTSVMAINPHVYSKLRYNALADFVPVSELLTVPYVLVASPQAPFGNLKELVEYARRNPGKVDYASLGVGTQPHMAMEVWQKRLGIRLNHVSYKGSPAADLMGGIVSLYLDPAPTAIPLVQARKLKALAASGRKRIAVLPDVPTATEFQRELETTAWQGVFAPKGTPPAIVNRLGSELARIVALPDVRQKLVDFGLDPTGTPPAGMAASLAADHAYWGKVVRDLGVRLE